MKLKRLLDYPFHPVWQVNTKHGAMGLLEYDGKEWRAYRGVGFACKRAGIFSCVSEAVREILNHE